MQFNPPAKIRGVIYIVTALGTPLIAYLLAKGIISSLEVTLWAAEVTAVNAMAALNVASK